MTPPIQEGEEPKATPTLLWFGSVVYLPVCERPSPKLGAAGR